MTRRKDPQPETLATTGDPSEGSPAEVSPTESAAPFTVEVGTAEALPPPSLPPEPALPPPPRRSGLLGTLLGGALAAIGGFALAHFNVFGLAPDSSTLTAQLDDAMSQQAAALKKVSSDVDTLAKRVAALESVPPPTAPDLSRLDALDERLAAIETMPTEGGASTAALTAKLAELERKLTDQPTGSADPALQQKLDDALARLNEAEAAATARAAEAEAASAAAQRDRALDALSAAVESGQPFTAELQAVEDSALAEALGPIAATGAPTLSKLQAGFPAPAREALLVARKTDTQDGWTDRLVDFLATQTGARSLTPREGSDPDAILSRAEFALGEGRVADALAELQALDPTIRAPLDAWSAEASAYLAATAALQTARGK